MKSIVILMATFTLIILSCSQKKTDPQLVSISVEGVKSAVPAVSSTPKFHSPCPPEMVHVHGNMCVKPLQVCADWIDDPTLPYARCAEYETGTECKGSRASMEFCIDKFEVADDDNMPIADVSWTESAARCSARGYRLCSESEWTFACEGEEMRPYPYGWKRRSDLCNHDIGKDLVCGKLLCDHRKPVNDPSLLECSTPEGIVNMTGNIDEWVVLDTPHYSQKNGNRKMMSGLKGGWWGNLRNRCRPVTVDHDEYFHELQTGFRCCSDVRPN